MNQNKTFISLTLLIIVRVETMSLKIWILFLTVIILQQLSTLSHNTTRDKTVVTKRQQLKINGKIKRTKSRVQYYANSTASFNIILSGDVEKNPGPVLSPKCTVCNKTVNNNHKRLICVSCRNTFHGKCANHCDLKQIQARVPKYFTCNNCHLLELPFAQTNILKDDEPTINNEIKQCQHLKILEENPNKLSIAHLNTQSLLYAQVLQNSLHLSITTTSILLPFPKRG